MRIITIKVPEELLEQVDEYIREQPAINSRSELIRIAIMAFLNRKREIPKQEYKEEILVIP